MLHLFVLIVCGWISCVGGTAFLWITLLSSFAFLDELIAVLGPLVPHHKVVSLIQCNGLLVQMWIACSKSLEELDGEFLTVSASLQPYLLKVAIVAKVLCNRYSQIQVLNAMPPLTRHKDGLTRILHALDYHR